MQLKHTALLVATFVASFLAGNWILFLAMAIYVYADSDNKPKRKRKKAETFRIPAIKLDAN